MHWCLAKEGSAAVQDQDEGVWIGTFRDAAIAKQVVQEHNSKLVVSEPNPNNNGTWTSKATWK